MKKTSEKNSNNTKKNENDSWTGDTQGYEKNILDGAKRTLEKKIIKIIETEIILDEVYSNYLTFKQDDSKVNDVCQELYHELESVANEDIPF